MKKMIKEMNLSSSLLGGYKMKFIHVADVHLGSSLLKFSKAKERNIELRNTFINMLEYARNHQIDHILISGDLFDHDHVNYALKKDMLSLFKKYDDLTFYYLRGNHDQEGFDIELKNVKMFNADYTYYKINNICIAGSEDPVNCDLHLDPQNFNIVMLHGDIHHEIELDKLRNHSIDYLALGHLHSYESGHLDMNSYYAYPGALEGRGYDEFGEKGFIELEITDHLEFHFVPFAYRTFYLVEVDITDTESDYDIEQKILNTISEYENKNIIQINLTGKIDVESEIDITRIEKSIKDQTDFYELRIKDQTDYKVDYAKYLHNSSLKGEFVRMVQESDEENKDEIIHYGLMALLRGEVE